MGNERNQRRAGGRWPESSGPWVSRTIIVSEEERHRALSRPGAVVVRTCLDLIAQLQDEEQIVIAVVLAGGFARDPALASFLVESYPYLRVVDGSGDADPDWYLPGFG